MIASPPLFEPAGSAAASPEPAPDRSAPVPDRDDFRRRGREHGQRQWVIGDWVLEGQTVFSLEYDELVEDSGCTEQTLRNCRNVAHRFEPNRRRLKLSFAHHAEVASLPPDEADALLELAEREGLKFPRFRALVAASRPDPEPAPLPSRSELVADLLSDAIGERQRLATLPGADRVRVAHEKYIAELESLVEHLNRFATLPDADAATDEELRGYRHGRRV